MSNPQLRTALQSAWSNRKYVARIGGYLAPYRVKVALAIIVGAGSAVLGLAPALVLRAVVNNLVHGRHSVGQAAALVSLGVLALILSGLLGVAESYLVLTVGKRVSATLRQQLFDHLLGQSVGYFTRSRTGELMSRVLNDVGALDGILGSTLLSLVTALCTMTASLVFMFFLSWQLSLVTLVVFPFVALFLRLGSRPIYMRQKAVQERFGLITAQIQEILGVSGMLLVKSFGRQRYERDRFTEANNELWKMEVTSAMAGQWTSMALSIVWLLGPIVLVLVGTTLVADHSISLGTLVAFATVAAAGFSGALIRISGGLITIIGSLPMWTRIFEVLDEPSDVRGKPLGRRGRVLRGRGEV